MTTDQHSSDARRLDLVETCRGIDIFENSFFSCAIIRWNKFDLDVRKSKSFAIF